MYSTTGPVSVLGTVFPTISFLACYERGTQIVEPSSLKLKRGVAALILSLSNKVKIGKSTRAFKYYTLHFLIYIKIFKSL